MNTIHKPLTPYLERLLDENYLLAREAQAVNRLPEALHERAVELSEAQRILAMEKIVSDLLNPMPLPAPTPSTPENLPSFFTLMIIVSIGGVVLGFLHALFQRLYP